MSSRYVLRHNAAGESEWLQVYVAPIGNRFAAMILAEEEMRPAPGQLKGLAFFGDTTIAAETQALHYLGAVDPHNRSHDPAEYSEAGAVLAAERAAWGAHRRRKEKQQPSGEK